jgi:hypothetical protein
MARKIDASAMATQCLVASGAGLGVAEIRRAMPPAQSDG